MSFSRKNSRGFTLVELMVSMAIGLMVLLLAASMLGRSGDGYERIGGRMAAEREARALISQLSSDLSTATFHEGTLFEKSSSSWPVDRIGFFSLQPMEAQTNSGHIGDLCAVNYYIKDLTMGGKTVRCLMRGFRESNDTFKALRDGSVTSLFDENSDLDEPVAFGVVLFQSRPRSRDSSGKWIDWIESDTTAPEGIDVRLVVARRDLTSKLKQSSDWDGAGSAQKLLGEPANAGRNKYFELYETTLRFGNHTSL